MPDDGKNLDIGVKITADTKGAAEAREALKDVGSAADRAAESAGGLVDKVGNAGEGFEETSHQAMEAAHALHGAEFAFRGIEDAASSGSISVISLVDSLRGLAMASGAGLLFGGVAAAITLAIAAFDALKKKIDDNKQAMADAGTAADDLKTHVDALVTAADALPTPAEQFKEAMEGARDALKEIAQLNEQQASSRLKLIDANEKLDLAKNEAGDTSIEEKARHKYEIETRYAGLRAQAQQAHIADQIAQQKQAMDLEDAATAKSERDRDQARAKMEQSGAYGDTIAGRMKRAASEKEPNLSDIKDEVGQKYGGYNLSHYQEAADLYDRRKESYDADQAWLKKQTDATGKPAGDNKAAADEAAGAAAALKTAQSNFDAQQKHSSDTYRAAQQKILELTNQGATDAQLAGIEQQTRDAAEIGRQKEEQEKLADKAAKEALDHGKEVQAAAQEAQQEAQRKEHERQVKLAELAVQQDDEAVNRAKLGLKAGGGEGTGAAVREGAHEGVKEGGREGAKQGAIEGVKEGLKEGLKEALGDKGSSGAPSQTVGDALKKREEDQKRLIELQSADDPAYAAQKEALEEAKLQDELLAESLREGTGATKEAVSEQPDGFKGHRDATAEADADFQEAFGARGPIFGPNSQMKGSALDHPGPASTMPDDRPQSIFGPDSQMRGSMLDQVNGARRQVAEIIDHPQSAPGNQNEALASALRELTGQISQLHQASTGKQTNNDSKNILKEINELKATTRKLGQWIEHNRAGSY